MPQVSGGRVNYVVDHLRRYKQFYFKKFVIFFLNINILGSFEGLKYHDLFSFIFKGYHQHY